MSWPFSCGCAVRWPTRACARAGVVGFLRPPGQYLPWAVYPSPFPFTCCVVGRNEPHADGTVAPPKALQNRREERQAHFTFRRPPAVAVWQYRIKTFDTHTYHVQQLARFLTSLSPSPGYGPPSSSSNRNRGHRLDRWLPKGLLSIEMLESRARPRLPCSRSSLFWAGTAAAAVPASPRASFLLFYGAAV